jgi:hypothetical protein
MNETLTLAKPVHPSTDDDDTIKIVSKNGAISKDRIVYIPAHYLSDSSIHHGYRIHGVSGHGLFTYDALPLISGTKVGREIPVTQKLLIGVDLQITKTGS